MNDNGAHEPKQTLPDEAHWPAFEQVRAVVREQASRAHPTADVLRRVSHGVLLELEAQARQHALRRYGWAVPAAALVIAGLTLVIVGPRFVSGHYSAEALGVAAVALLVLIMASFGRSAVALALGASVLLTLGAAEGGSAALHTEWHCALLEVGTALGPCAALVWIAWRNQLSMTSGSYAAVGAGGALLGQAALHVLCGGHNVAYHIWVFHTGVVFVLTALALLWPRVRGESPRTMLRF